jgi:hypothetical protein
MVPTLEAEAKATALGSRIANQSQFLNRKGGEALQNVRIRVVEWPTNFQQL